MVPMLRTCGEADASSACEIDRPVRAHRGMRGDVAHARHRPEPQAVVSVNLNTRQADVFEVHELGRCLDVVLHQLHQVGAAGDELGTMRAGGGECGVE